MKVRSTHLMTPILGVVHVEMARQQLINRLALINSMYTPIGIDLPILAKFKKNEPYRRTKIWVGLDEIKRSYVVEDHEVEVSAEPLFTDADYSKENDNGGSSGMGGGGSLGLGDLEVSL